MVSRTMRSNSAAFTPCASRAMFPWTTGIARWTFPSESLLASALPFKNPLAFHSGGVHNAPISVKRCLPPSLAAAVPQLDSSSLHPRPKR